MPEVLGIFAKQPVAGQVKTRLAQATSPAWAAQVAEACLCDVLDRCAHLADCRMLVYAPREAQGYFATVANSRYELQPQTHGDLGQRLKSFFREQLTNPGQRVVVLGTDSPTLPLEFVSQAFELLTNHDVVLGPATDGGYYLVGCTGQVPPIFEGIAWGTSTVLAETVQKLPPSCRLALLPAWYDLDTLEDWQMLKGHVLAQRRAGLDLGVPHLEQLLEWNPAIPGSWQKGKGSLEICCRCSAEALTSPGLEQ